LAMATTTTTTLAATPTATDHAPGRNGSGPTSSPLLFFVALGFGVVFTNLWIIVGVKYCFRFNQRNRQARILDQNGEPIDLGSMQRPRRRRREKKLMTMDEVNRRFPLTKLKTWRATREAQGLPAHGGVNAEASQSDDSAMELASAEQRSTEERDITDAARPSAAGAEQSVVAGAEKYESIPLDDGDLANTNAATSQRRSESITHEKPAQIPADSEIHHREGEEEGDDDDDIVGEAPQQLLDSPGDACAICLDTLEDDDDVRGLTCGHAFHGACVDPWLTGRRACCPLCKADYHTPTPRADGDDAQSTRRIQNISRNTPWAARSGNFFRQRLLMSHALPFGNPGEEQTTTRQEESTGESRWRRFRLRIRRRSEVTPAELEANRPQ
ncbi:hypothetical protein K470DRAFT_221521, partial [Piedraia hortae CBS 480.64]